MEHHWSSRYLGDSTEFQHIFHIIFYIELNIFFTNFIFFYHILHKVKREKYLIKSSLKALKLTRSVDLNKLSIVLHRNPELSCITFLDNDLSKPIGQSTDYKETQNCPNLHNICRQRFARAICLNQLDKSTDCTKPNNSGKNFKFENKKTKSSH